MLGAGTRLGPYELVSEIGSGGHGVVWEARHVSLGRRVAIKLLRPELAADAELLRRFFIEARAAARVAHAGIVTVFDVGDGAGGAYIAMEFLTGESLGTCLRRSGSLAISRTVALAHQIAAALVAVHAAGIIHRDLKPDNLFLVPDDSLPQGERVKILDFGIAKLRPSQTDHIEATAEPLTRQGIVIGTPTYMAPEQCKGNQPLDERTDVYALGCVLFRMLTGRAPFEATSPSEVIAAHLLTLPPRVTSLRADVPEPLATLVAVCLEKDPARRPASMQVIVDTLDGLRDRGSRDAHTPTVPPPISAGEPTLTRTAASETAPESPPRQRSVGWLVALGLAAAGAAVAIVVGNEAPSSAPAAFDAASGGTTAPVEAAFPAPALDAALIDAAEEAAALDAGPIRRRPPRTSPSPIVPSPAVVTPSDAAPPSDPKPARIGDDSLDPFDPASRR